MDNEPTLEKILEQIKQSESQITSDIKYNTAAILQQSLSDKTLIIQSLTNLSVEQKLTFNRILELQAQVVTLLNEILRKVDK